MKIVSINKAQTQGLHHVAFNIEGTADPEVVQLVKLNNVSFSLEGSVLKVRVATEEPVGSTSIVVFQQALDDAAALKRHKEEEAARKRERMLHAVQANTGLELK